jgi:hypothetical protein
MWCVTLEPMLYQLGVSSSCLHGQPCCGALGKSSSAVRRASAPSVMTRPYKAANCSGARIFCAAGPGQVESFDTEEVTGSIPVSPTSLRRSEASSRGRGPASRSFAISLPSRHAGVLRQELNKPGTEWRRPAASVGRLAGPRTRTGRRSCPRPGTPAPSRSVSRSAGSPEAWLTPPLASRRYSHHQAPPAAPGPPRPPGSCTA